MPITPSLPRFSVRKALLTIVLAVCVLNAVPRAADILDSILPLQRVYTNEAGESTRINVCTTWPVRIEDGRTGWMTALHCTRESQGEGAELFIDGHEVHILKSDPPHDLVLLSGPNRKHFQVAIGVPKQGAELWSAGYPNGHSTRHALVGVLTALKDDDDGPAVYQLPAAPGMSGAPVVDRKTGLVIGLILQSECNWQGWCPVSRGAPVAILREFLGLD